MADSFNYAYTRSTIVMKALVTGATGFIGSHLAEALLARGYSVKCLVRSSSNLKWIETLLTPQKVSDSFGAPSVELFYGDCGDADSLRDAVEDCDYVFHLAGLTKAAREDDFFSVNVKGTENIVNSILKNDRKLKRFVFLSSLSAIGPSLNGSPVTENAKPHPVSAYGRSKLEAEKIVSGVMDRIPATIIRPPAVYGPRDRDFYLLFKLIKWGLFPYWGKSYYSLIYIDDLINGILLSAEKDNAEGKLYFLSDTEVHTNEEIALEIARIFEKPLTKVRIPKSVMPLFATIGEKFHRGGIINRDKILELHHPCWLCDSTLVTRELGYKPTVKLKDGLKWTADWYRINRWL